MLLTERLRRIVDDVGQRAIEIERQQRPAGILYDWAHLGAHRGRHLGRTHEPIMVR